MNFICMELIQDDTSEEVSVIPRMCPNCKCDDYDFDVCRSCGFIDPNQICEEQEWRDFQPDSGASGNVSQSRVGMASNPLFSERFTQSTVMQLGFNATYAQRRLRKFDFHQVSNHKDRSLNVVYVKIDHVCTLIPVSSQIAATAKQMYKYFVQHGPITRGHVRLGIIACCILLSCKFHDVTRSSHEVQAGFVDYVDDPKECTKLIGKHKEQFFKVMENNEVVMAVKNRTIEATCMVGRMMSELHDLPDTDRRRLTARARKILNEIRKYPEMDSKTPKAVLGHFQQPKAVPPISKIATKIYIA